MKIEIIVFKDNGKFYADGIAECEADIPLWEDEFRRFVAANLPALLNEGFVIVRDSPDADRSVQSFHIALYRCAEIMPFLNR